MRLIDADALLEVCKRTPGISPFALAHLEYILERQPTFEKSCDCKDCADRPPKGKWRLLNGKWTCSECGNKTDWPLKICNGCESEMEIEI